MVETAGIESSSANFYNSFYFNKLNKTIKLPTMRICAVVCRYVRLFPEMVTFLVTVLFLDITF